MQDGSVEKVGRSLFGTDEPSEPLRRLRAGALSVDLAGAALRMICWEGVEILRGIAFVVRDEHWGTYRLKLDSCSIETHENRFAVTFRAACSDGAFRFEAAIEGHADGRLSYRAQGVSPNGFWTNRTGFVVLHALDGSVGRPLHITHPDGRTETTRFPAIVQPHQPVLDIAELSHEPLDGLVVSTRFEGDTFEMEDHRNWTDASFKTYVRPLALPFPYRLHSGEMVRQAVHVTVSGKAAATRPDRDGPAVLEIGTVSAARLPRLGLYADDDLLATITKVHSSWAGLNAGFLQVRLDTRRPTALDRLRIARNIAAVLGCPVQLDAIVAAADTEAEMDRIAALMTDADVTPEALFLIPARSLYGEGPRGEAPLADLLSAARRKLPALFLYAGAPTHFTELNRDRPSAGYDGIAHATAATVHAADDLSVMETLEALPDIVASARTIAGAVPYRIGPAGIGMVQSASNSRLAPNPECVRKTQALNDPRQSGLFAASFLVGYIAAAKGADALTLGAPVGPWGLFEDDGQPRPAAHAFAGLAALGGSRQFAVANKAQGRIAAVCAETPGGPELWLANLSAAPIGVTVEGATFSTVEIPATEGRSGRALQPGPLELPPYAVARLRGRA